MLKDRELEDVERVHARVIGGVHGGNHMRVHVAVAPDARRPLDQRRRREPRELRGEVQVDAGVNPDVGVVELHPATESGKVFLVVRLRRVHVEVPVPSEVRDLLRLQVQEAVLRVEGGRGLASRREAAVVLLDAVDVVEVLELVLHGAQLVLHAVEHGQLAAALLEVLPVRAPIGDHLGVLREVGGLHGHVREVEVDVGHRVRDARELLRAEPNPVHGAVLVPDAVPDVTDPVQEVCALQVRAPVHVRGADEDLAHLRVVDVRGWQLDLEVVLCALGQADAVLGLGVQGQDGVGVRVHRPPELHVAAVLEPLLHQVRAPADAALAVLAGQEPLFAELLQPLRPQLLHASKGHEALCTSGQGQTKGHPHRAHQRHPYSERHDGSGSGDCGAGSCTASQAF
mmetsp:Transcript_37398/g.98911  ORF Transcript_37398/g.98911 Transcript_37398/m.98911 type:complete len:399 (-) Transcript_37398:51-1247(-)